MHQRVFGNHIGPTGGNGNQMRASFPVEVDSMLSPGLQVGDEFELLTGPRVKRMGDSETSTQLVPINRS